MHPLTRLGLAAALLAGCAGADARESYLQDAYRPVGGADLAVSRSARAVVAEIAARSELTMSDCLRLALHNAYALQARGERVVQADADRREAIAALLPRAAVHGQFIRSSSEFRILNNEVPANRLEFYFTASQTLFDGRALADLDLAAQTRQIQLLHLADERDRLLFDVAAAFYEVLGLESSLAAVEPQLAFSREHLRVLQAKERAGEAGPEDLLLARARLDEAEAGALQLQGELARARSRLARLTGLRPFRHALRDSYEVRWTPEGLPQLVDRALEQRADLQVARREGRRQELLRRRSNAEYLPTAVAQGTYWARRQDFERDINWTVAVYADLVLFDAGREARRARAYSAEREARLEVARREAEVQHEIEDALIAFRSVDQLLRMLESRLAAADEQVARSRSRVAAGTETDLGLLAATEAQASTRRDLERARFARTLALLRIRLVAGDLRGALDGGQP